MLERLTKISRSLQILISLGLVVLISGICYLLSDWMDYKVVAFLLLLIVSLIAIMFDIFPVLVAASLSALVWNFFS